MNNNWFIAFMSYQFTSIGMSSIPRKMLWVFWVFVIGSILGNLFDPGVKEYKPIKRLTYTELIRACRTELGLEGYTQDSLNRITDDLTIQYCSYNYPYILVDANDTVIRTNNLDRPQRQNP
jgi:hypothetical protein